MVRDIYFFCKQKKAYELRSSDWSSDVCYSDLQALREIRVHGQSARYFHSRIGVGGRMDTLQCAVVLAKLQRFEWEIAQRVRIGQRYLDLLEELPVQTKIGRASCRERVCQYV